MLALFAVTPTLAHGAAINWSAPRAIPSGGTLESVSCASESLCVAVDGEGEAFVSGNPTAGTPSWSATAIDTSEDELDGVSCAPGGPCVAVDRHGNAFVDPQPGSSSWSARVPLAGAPRLSGVSCPTSTLCVAVDEAGGVWTSADPGSSGSWTPGEFGAEHRWTGVSCASTALCAAVDAEGAIASSSDPTGGQSAWHVQPASIGPLLAVSCASAALCVAGEEGGVVFASGDPAASAPSWILTSVDPGQPLAGVSCTAPGLCAAVDGAGRALASTSASGSVPEWSQPASVDSHPLTDVSCLASGFCLAIDTAGQALAGRVPAPAVTTLAPTQVSATGATLTGVVETNSALLQSCTFALGPGGTGMPLTQSLPCAAAASSISGRQEVSAQLSGLAPNTIYHYKLTAANATGTGAGEEVAFTTAPSSQIALVTPHPSISGTPAVGQKLTCHPGTPVGAAVRLTYAWVRDLIPIPSTGATTYTVKGQDSGHHLQCQVTATDGGGSVSAKSAFESIPVGGAPVSAGETAVGRASFAKGKLSVPLLCSPRASHGCHVTLRLVGVRHASPTLASARARLSAGARATVSAKLGAAGRRLLASAKHLSAYVYVSGTVIGVIEAQLARELITLRTSGHTTARATSAPAARMRAAGAGAASARAAAARADAPAAHAAGGILAARPYMGWDTYFALGGRYSEATILAQASQLISLGLRRAGYDYVWLDVGWWHGTRAADGEITVSAKQWPHGLAWLTGTLHAAGFRVGLYTDAGPNGCGGAGQGSYDHYQQDVNTFAAWGFDAVKVDFCGGSEYGLNPAAAYTAFHEAIIHNSRHRPMLLAICNFLQPEQYGEGKPPLGESAFSSYTFGPTVGNSWRTDTDVGRPGSVPFADVLRNIDADAASPQAAGPGHWNDPDYLAPDQGMSATQFRSQLSMWAMLAAPLMVSDNLDKIGGPSLETVLNGEVIAIDQDPAGVQATLLSTVGAGQVWVKPLVDGTRAVALLNRGTSALEIRTSAQAVGLAPAPGYSVRNVWTHATSTAAGTLSAEVPADGTVLLRVSPR